MSRDILTHHITATGTGADDETRYKALASDAAQKIAQYLAVELPGFAYDGITFDGTDNYLPYQVRLTNSGWGCELIVSANAKWYYGSTFSSGYSFGLSFNFKLLQNGTSIGSYSSSSDDYVAASTSGNIATSNFDLKVYRIESALFAVAFSYKSPDANKAKCFSFASFTGSYDSEIYVGYDYETSLSSGITLPETMYWCSQGKRRNLNFSSSGTPRWLSKGYYWRPYCWPAYYSPHNCGIALFDGQYVLYQLWSNDANTYVTTSPEATYTVDGQELPAVSTRLLIPRANPFRKLQKPGEVLTW